ncbi:hypothetical protein LOSG293_011580 [Secundilactobacillus oryzae JCM 18671]|uniref:Uncharacterized protein n=1 Tax=Secundilactobacillus oryzae JCM 18671 TaxID=1291743 RepID=A0A081BG89_9LACO|nr:hypothetical protein [Secundilactobacillus oryzae]GAK47057.1 hypothetical protein LOSG293_011580 [Secundilactobacillus oryzae JCM 18671]
MRTFEKTIEDHIESFEACKRHFKPVHNPVFEIKVQNKIGDDPIWVMNDGMKLLSRMLISDGIMEISVNITGTGITVKKRYAIRRGKCQLQSFRGYVHDESLDFGIFMERLDSELLLIVKVDKPSVIFPNLFIAM